MKIRTIHAARTLLGFAGGLLLVVSCQCLRQAEAPATAPATAAAREPGAAAPSAVAPWDELTRAQRMERMKKVVYPKMKSEFAAFDAERFAGMKCVTCHGDGAKDETFKMPNPQLPKLPADEEGFRKLFADEPEITRFMVDVVETQMAAMLGEKPYDPATHQGFGCFECHTKK